MNVYLTPKEWLVLKLIKENKKMRLKEITKYNVSYHSLVGRGGIIERLKSFSFIKTEINGKNKIVYITSKGEEFVEKNQIHFDVVYGCKIKI